MAAIGIDLGTTKSCVGVWQNGKVTIITNDHGNRLTPSCVAFTKTERLIGDSAKNQVGINPENTIYNLKRFIGRRFNDEILQKNLENWPFNVVNQNGKLQIEVISKGDQRTFVPEAITAMILTKMKEAAEIFLKTDVQNVIITVPACFNDSQRQATRDAAKIAGLNVLGIINEPTAVALAYAHDKKIEGKRKILIYNFGGGYCDVSLVTITDGTFFEVNASCGDPHLGGEDFDNRLFNHLIQEIRSTYNIDITTNKRKIERLRKEVERIKRVLSSGPEAIVEIDALCDDNDFVTKISREDFEKICSDLFYSIVSHVEQVLLDARMTKTEIDDVILVGGSSRIPKIQLILQEFFDKKLLTMNMNAEEAIAYGATIYAGNLSAEKEWLNVKDISQYSLVFNEIIVIDRNSLIPSELRYDCDDKREIIIYQRDHNNKDSFLGKVCLPDSTLIQQLSFHMDKDGILDIVPKPSNGEANLLIKRDNGCLEPEEVTNLRFEEEIFKEEDIKIKKCVAARYELEQFVFSTKNNANSPSSNLSKSEKLNVVAQCDEIIKCVDSYDILDRTEYECKLKWLQTQMSNLTEMKSVSDDIYPISKQENLPGFNIHDRHLKISEDTQPKENQNIKEHGEEISGNVLNFGRTVVEDGIIETSFDSNIENPKTSKHKCTNEENLMETEYEQKDNETAIEKNTGTLRILDNSPNLTLIDSECQNEAFVTQNNNIEMTFHLGIHSSIKTENTEKMNAEIIYMDIDDTINDRQKNTNLNDIEKSKEGFRLQLRNHIASTRDAFKNFPNVLVCCNNIEEWITSSSNSASITGFWEKMQELNNVIKLSGGEIPKNFEGTTRGIPK